METIYLLSDPRTGEPRYVGVTSRLLSARLKQHRHQALGGVRLPVHDWHRKLIGLGLWPVCSVLETTADRGREAYWIAKFRAESDRMLNLADGGNEAPSSNPLVAAKIGKALRGVKHSPERAKKAALARVGMKHSDQTKAKMRKPKTSEHRENARLALNAKRAAGQVRLLTGDANPMRMFPEKVLRGSANALAKVTEADVIAMRERFLSGTTAAVLAREFNIAVNSARRIVLGLTWAHLPGACAPRGKGHRGFAAAT